MEPEEEMLFKLYGIKGYADCPPALQSGPQESVIDEK